MAEPTAEHFEEARAWLLRHVDRDLFPEAYVIDLAEALAAREARGFERGRQSAPKIPAPITTPRGNPEDAILRIKRVRDSFGLAEPGNVAPGRPGLKETKDAMETCDWDEARCRALLIDRGHAKEPR